ncbi:MAG: GAF domain-containing protein [Nitrospinota bacterium]|nr:MAG: GAF domain-containing protein [Nitrospinota bacterium]
MRGHKARSYPPREPTMATVRDLHQQIARLNRIGIALSSEHNLRNLLELIVKEAREFTQADGGSLYLIKGEKLVFEVAQNATLDKRLGRSQEAFRPFPIPLTCESMAGYVALTGKVLNIEDVYTIPVDAEYHFNAEFDRRNHYRTQSMLTVPMRDNEDQIIGVLQLINSLNEHGEVVPFLPEYEELVLSLASQAAVAINNARLIQQIKELFEAIVQYSVEAIDRRSRVTSGHSARVVRYATFLVDAINRQRNGPFGEFSFSPEEIEEIRVAAWLHDIGKIAVREAILEKENKLTESEMEAVRERFAAIQLDAERCFLERKLALLSSGEPSPEALEQLEQERIATLQEIRDDLAFLERVNIPGYLEDADLQRLQAIAAKTYQAPSGEQKPYLTASEYANLSIRRGNLTEEELQHMRSHVLHTKDMLSKIPFTKNLRNVPLYAGAHHEMLDGSGYPEGLKGEQIPLQARILAVVDVYEALTAPDRPYKKPMPAEQALQVLRSEAGRGRLDKDLVELFIEERVYEKAQGD